MTQPAKHITDLFHHRWAVPTLALLHDEGGGAKFVTLCKKSGAGRESMRRTLEALMDLGLVMRNPGYGHPMRPEYIFTKMGTNVSAPSAALWRAIVKADIAEAALKKWSLPTLAAIGTGAARFGEIAEALDEVTPRALAQTLQDLQAANMIERELKDGAPPFAEYRARSLGKRLAAKVAVLKKAMA